MNNNTKVVFCIFLIFFVLNAFILNPLSPITLGAQLLNHANVTINPINITDNTMINSTGKLMNETIITPLTNSTNFRIIAGNNQTIATFSLNSIQDDLQYSNETPLFFQTSVNNSISASLEEMKEMINMSLSNQNASSTKKSLEVTPKSEDPGDFWNLRITDYISIILGLIALVAIIPYLINLFFAQFYKPKIEAFIPPSFHYEKSAKVKWSDLSNLTNFRNNTLRRFTIEIEIIMDRSWPDNPAAAGVYPFSGLKGGYPLQGGFWRKTNSRDFPGGGGIMALSFPFQPQQEECHLEIVIYPRMHLSEFGFPRYFGEVYLRPIREIFRVTLG